MLVVELAYGSVNDDGIVVNTEQVVVSGRAQRPDGAFELPGLRRARGIPRLPGDIDLQAGRNALRERGFDSAQAHHFVDVVQHGLGAGFQAGDKPSAR